MSRLTDWQAGLARLIDAAAPDEVCLASTVDVPGLSTEQGCSVYRNSSRGARRHALEDTFSVCRRLVGEKCFGAFAMRFVEQSPSRDADLNQFGEGFPAHVAETVATQPSLGAYPWLGDLVHLEWLCHAIYYRNDDPAFEPGILHDLDPSGVSIEPTQRVAWMRSAWPVHQIWELHQSPDEPPRLQMEAGDWHLVIERHNHQAKVSATDALLWSLLNACTDRPCIAKLAADSTLATERLGELLSRGWIRVVRSTADAV